MSSGIVVLLVSAVLSGAYSAILQRLHDIYAPDHIWVTVVIGNILIGGSFAALAAFDLVPWAAVGWLVGVNVAYGLPVIVWQVWQADQRRKQRGL